jgi:hypothetical protein
MAEVNGVGPAKLKKFGTAFLEVLAQGPEITVDPDGA